MVDAQTLTSTEFWLPILTSLQVIIFASVIAFVLALLTAWLMKNRSFKGKSLIETVFLLPLVLPPTVVGFGLLVILGRNSWAGQVIEWLFHQPLVFTKGAAIIAAVVVAFPLVYMMIKTGFDSIEKDYVDAARAMGAGAWQVLWYVMLPLAKRSLLSGFILGFTRGLGEFGATLMFAGNIPGRTETLPTAIFLAVESGHMTMAYEWVIFIMILSFALLTVAYRTKI